MALKKSVFAGAALLTLPVLLALTARKAVKTAPHVFRDAPVSAAGQLEGLAPAGPAAPAAPAPGLAAAAAEGNTAAELARRCAPAAKDEPILRQSDFRWNYTLPEILSRSSEIYVSPKRLAERAYWDAKTGAIRLPYLAERGGPVEISPAFVTAVQRQLEKALELGYADAVFFPDMGHSHLLVPDKLWKTKYDLYPISDTTGMYRDMFKDPRVQLFYHTAEQLKARGEDGQLVSDAATRFRYRNRNISGFIKPDPELYVHQNPGSSANTVSGVPGYFWWGAGFNVSAQKDGCFVYNSKGKSYRFDLSLYDLPEDPGGVFVKGPRPPAALRYPPECVLKAVAEQMGQKYRPDIPLPKIYLEHRVTLKQFQDAVEKQWGLRPGRITNVYAWDNNEIYLMTDAAWYAGHERSLDDSLAHEFVHYVQHRYRGWDLATDDPIYEPQAVEFQTWFRENYIVKPGACPAK